MLEGREDAEAGLIIDTPPLDLEVHVIHCVALFLHNCLELDLEQQQEPLLRGIGHALVERDDAGFPFGNILAESRILDRLGGTFL